MSSAGQPDPQQLQQRLQALIEGIARAEPALLESARELVQIVLALHTSGLRQMLELIRQSPEGGALLEQLARDPQSRGLLLLHELHPQDLHSRVQQATDQLRPHLAVQGVRIERVLLNDAVVGIHLGRGTPVNGRLPAPERLRHEIEECLLEAAPDLQGIEIEGLPAPEVTVPVSTLTSHPRTAGRRDAPR